jgi:hypothetical protein
MLVRRCPALVFPLTEALQMTEPSAVAQAAAVLGFPLDVVDQPPCLEHTPSYDLRKSDQA